MSRPLLVAIALATAGLVACTAREAGAQDRVDPLPIATSPAFLSTVAAPIRLPDLEHLVPPSRVRSLPRAEPAAPVLASLYATTVVMQALDVHSTLRAIDRGAVEANPLMAGLARNKVAFVGVKAAVAVGTVYATRELARRNKVAAIVTAVAINGVYAWVAHHNYTVARRLR